MSNYINVAVMANGICVQVKQVKSDYVLSAGEIEIPVYDASIIKKSYNQDTGEFYLSQGQKEVDAIEWRDSELVRTDTLMLLSDYPFKEQMTVYRQALRDWPSTADFPDTKPVFN